MSIQDVSRTFNPTFSYKFSWTIDNFHLSPSLTVRGAVFSPITGYSKKFCFELTFKKEPDGKSHLLVDLIYLNTQVDHLTVKGNISLSNKQRKLFSRKVSTRNVTPITNIALINSSSLAPNFTPLPGLRFYPGLLSCGLKDGKIILQGTLTFAGYNMTSSNRTISSQQVSELVQDLKNIFESGLGSDVTFTVDHKTLRAHKQILISRSHVFSKMFEHNMLENNTNNVFIEDTDFDTFHRFLLFLYTGSVEDGTYQSMTSLYSVAQKYQVTGLRKTCFAYLANKLSVESVCDVLVLADLHDDKEFKGLVLSFLREKFFDIVSTDMWIELVTNKPALAREVADFMKPSCSK